MDQTLMPPTCCASGTSARPTTRTAAPTWSCWTTSTCRWRAVRSWACWAGPGQRQVDAAADHRRPAGADLGGGDTWRGAGAAWPGRRRGDGVPELRAVPVADGAGERGAGAGGAGRRPGGAGAAGRGGDRPDRPGRLRERLSQGAVGRHAAARGPGAGAGGAPGPAADGRAVQRAGRADRRDAAHRPHRPVERGQAAGQAPC